MSRGRREFPAYIKREANERSGGICECHRVPQLNRPDGCGQRLGPGNTFYEHIVCDELGGEPTLENCAVLVKTCWREKTDSYDLRVIPKANRQRDRNMGIARSDGPKGPPLLGSRKSGWRRPVYGRPERRHDVSRR